MSFSLTTSPSSPLPLQPQSTGDSPHTPLPCSLSHQLSSLPSSRCTPPSPFSASAPPSPSLTPFTMQSSLSVVPPPIAPPPGSSVHQQIEYYLAIINLYTPFINPHATPSPAPSPSSSASPSPSFLLCPQPPPSLSSSLLLTEREMRGLSALIAPHPRAPLLSLPSTAPRASGCPQPSTSLAYMTSLPTLPASRYHRVRGEECPICQELLVPPQHAQQQPPSPTLTPSSTPSSASPPPRVLVLPCHHLFHDACVLRWLLQRNTCPCCRYQLPTDSQLYNRRVVQQQPPPLKRKFSAAELHFIADADAAAAAGNERQAKRMREEEEHRRDCCALSAEGVDCVLLPEGLGVPGAAQLERLRCGHSFHRQCLVTAGQLMGVNTKVKRMRHSHRHQPAHAPALSPSPSPSSPASAPVTRPSVFCPLCCAYTEHAE